MARINKDLPHNIWQKNLITLLDIWRYFDFNIYTNDIYPVELSLNKANIDYIERLFLDLSIHIDNGKLNTKIYNKRDDFSFPIVNYPFQMVTSPCHHYMVFTYHN